MVLEDVNAMPSGHYAHRHVHGARQVPTHQKPEKSTRAAKSRDAPFKYSVTVPTSTKLIESTTKTAAQEAPIRRPFVSTMPMSGLDRLAGSPRHPTIPDIKQAQTTSRTAIKPAPTSYHTAIKPAPTSSHTAIKPAPTSYHTAIKQAQTTSRTAVKPAPTSSHTAIKPAPTSSHTATPPKQLNQQHLLRQIDAANPDDRKYVGVDAAHCKYIAPRNEIMADSVIANTNNPQLLTKDDRINLVNLGYSRAARSSSTKKNKKPVSEDSSVYISEYSDSNSDSSTELLQSPKKSPHNRRAHNEDARTAQLSMSPLQNQANSIQRLVPSPARVAKTSTADVKSQTNVPNHQSSENKTVSANTDQKIRPPLPTLSTVITTKVPPARAIKVHEEGQPMVSDDTSYTSYSTLSYSSLSSSSREQVSKARKLPKQESKTRKLPKQESKTRKLPKQESKTRKLPKQVSKTRKLPKQVSKTREHTPSRALNIFPPVATTETSKVARNPTPTLKQSSKKLKEVGNQSTHPAPRLSKSDSTPNSEKRANEPLKVLSSSVDHVKYSLGHHNGPPIKHSISNPLPIKHALSNPPTIKHALLPRVGKPLTQCYPSSSSQPPLKLSSSSRTIRTPNGGSVTTTQSRESLGVTSRKIVSQSTGPVKIIEMNTKPRNGGRSTAAVLSNAKIAKPSKISGLGSTMTPGIEDLNPPTIGVDPNAKEAVVELPKPFHQGSAVKTSKPEKTILLVPSSDVLRRKESEQLHLWYKKTDCYDRVDHFFKSVLNPEYQNNRVSILPGQKGMLNQMYGGNHVNSRNIRQVSSVIGGAIFS